MSNSHSINVSFPFFTVLTLIFITLKLTNNIAWSWWWVLAPIWIPAAFIFGVFVTIAVIALIVIVVKALLD